MYYWIITWMFFIWLERCWMAFSRKQRCPPPQSINKEKPFNQKLQTCLNQSSGWTTRQTSCSVFMPLRPKVGSILFYLGLFITSHLWYMFCLLNASYSFKIVTFNFTGYLYIYQRCSYYQHLYFLPFFNRSIICFLQRQQCIRNT